MSPAKLPRFFVPKSPAIEGWEGSLISAKNCSLGFLALLEQKIAHSWGVSPTHSTSCRRSMQQQQQRWMFSVAPASSLFGLQRRDELVAQLVAPLSPFRRFYAALGLARENYHRSGYKALVRLGCPPTKKITRVV